MLKKMILLKMSWMHPFMTMLNAKLLYPSGQYLISIEEKKMSNEYSAKPRVLLEPLATKVLYRIYDEGLRRG